MRIGLLAVLAAAPLFAQPLDSNSVTVTASRQIDLTADQVVLTLTVTSGLDANQDDVDAALRNAGIPAQFARVGMDSDAGKLTWTYTLAAPLADLKKTAAALKTAQQTMAGSQSAFALRFGVSGVQASAAQQAAVKCPQSALIAAARQQAQQLTDAAGVVLGPLLSVADAPYQVGATWFNTTVIAAFLFVPQYAVSPVTCSVTVKFGLSRY
jgi:uncharacterized protein YggE